MYQESGNLYLIKLKTLLRSKYLYLVLFLFTLIITIIFNTKSNESIYNLNDKVFYMKVSDYKIKDNKITLNMSGREDLIGNFYYKDDIDINQIKYGVIVKVVGKLRIPSSNTVPHTFNYKEYLEKKNIHYTLNIEDIKIVKDESFIYKLKNWIRKRIDKIDSTGYMQAFILGDKSLIEDDNYSSFKSIGITHLFALSGMHIGLLSEILLKLLKRLDKALKYLFIDFFLIIYGFIVCFPASIKRCIVFYILNSINKVFGFDLSNKQILFLTVMILILFNPYIVFDTGFLFSVCTVGGIIFCEEYIRDDNKIKGAFKLSLVAFLFSAPINLYTFYEINLLSVFYNLVFIPFISMVVYPLSLLSFIFPFLSYIFSSTIKILEWSSGVLANIRIFNIFMSFNIYEVLLFYLGLYFLFVRQQKRWICLLLLIILVDIILPFVDKCSYVYFLDVGQGDASLLISSNRRSVTMIDTGGLANYDVSERYIPLFKYLGINTIDNLILTHGDFDHMGSAESIINTFKVKKVIFNCGEFNDLEKELIKLLNMNNINYDSCLKELNINKNKLYFLQTKDYDDENENSNVIYTSIDDYYFLFMGDAGKEKEMDILNSFNLSNIDVLKVGHHGSKTSSGKQFVDMINPKYSIISVGKYNKYGHPNNGVLNNLKKSKIYRTDQDGSVMFKIKNHNLSVK